MATTTLYLKGTTREGYTPMSEESAPLPDHADLTRMIDAVGIDLTLDWLVLYCYRQAINLRARAPGSSLVRDWEKTARLLERVRLQVRGMQL